MNPVRLWRWSCAAHRKHWWPVARLLKAVNFLVFKAILPPEATLGDSLILEHYGLGVVVHPNVVIGHGVRIYHHVTLAAESPVGSPHKIVLGDGVTIGAGASVIARSCQSLFVGDGAMIGAGAVVTRDVAPGQTVIGVPARPIASSGECPRSVGRLKYGRLKSRQQKHKVRLRGLGNKS